MACRATGRHQHGIQRIEVGDARHGHQVVAPEIAAFAFNAALLVPLARRAELGGKPPVRAERQEPHRLLPPVAAQDLANRTGQIVVAQQVEYAAEIGERLLVGFQECLLRRMQVGAMERRSAGHRPHREHLHVGPLVAEIDPGFIPVDLRLLSPAIALRNERLPSRQTRLPLALAHVVAHRRLRHRGVGELRQDPTMDAPGGVALLARRLTVRLQHLVDEVHDRTELRLGPRWISVSRRQRTANRLPHHAPVNTELGSDTRDRADAKLMLPAKLFEQIHFGSPVHARPPDPVGRP